jgi:hypothetical protein
MIRWPQFVVQSKLDREIDLQSMEILSEISIDHFEFKVTCNFIINGACVLWVRDTRTSELFAALGRFTRFDKRNVLFFVSRYVTSNKLRTEIENRRFESKVSGLPQQFFTTIEKLSVKDKETAYRQLFDLDSEIDSESLKRRRRIMSKRFHPDAGGDDRTMSLINEAYDFLLPNSSS